MFKNRECVHSLIQGPCMQCCIWGYSLIYPQYILDKDDALIHSFCAMYTYWILYLEIIFNIFIHKKKKKNQEHSLLDIFCGVRHFCAQESFRILSKKKAYSFSIEKCQMTSLQSAAKPHLEGEIWVSQSVAHSNGFLTKTIMYS